MTRSAKDTPEAEPSPEQVRRGRRMAMLLFAIGFGPMIFATMMFYTGWFNPGGQSNNGTLVQPPVSVTEFHLLGENGQPLEDRFGPEHREARWMLLVSAGTCDADCEQLLYLARQVNVALGKNSSRVTRGAWLDEVPEELGQRWSTEYTAMERLTLKGETRPTWPQGVEPQNEPRILLVDPFGNVMLHYGTEHTGKQILSDLKHLLQLSQIG